MANYEIGIGGLTAAQRGLDIIGNNIANAATEGYHRQRVEFSPAYGIQYGDMLLGGGVEIKGITRLIDNMLEKEIVNQTSSLEKTTREYNILRTIENALGEFSTENGINKSINDFFNSLADLSLHPTEGIWQSEVITSAQAMTSQFNAIGNFLSKTENQIELECDNLVEQVNALVEKIANLNDTIEGKEMGGNYANNLKDERDRYILELSKLIQIETQQREFGVVDITASGILLVAGADSQTIEAGLTDDGKLGISPEGTFNFITELEGGKLGGILSLKNEILSGVRNDLDAIAVQIITQVNSIHVQGINPKGSFADITGWPMPNESLSDFVPPVTDGNIYIRLTNTAAGEITREAVAIDAASDDLSAVAAKIDAIDGLTASVIDSKLYIAADAGYKFDFIPAVLPEPTSSNLTGTSAPAVSIGGIYNGDENKTLYFTFEGTGEIGNGILNLVMEEDDGAGGRNRIAILNVGSGYAAGDKLNAAEGIEVSLGVGDVNDGDTFEADVYSDSDTSGFLSAAGINTFFKGSDAETIKLTDELAESPYKIAISTGPEMSDNENVKRLSALREQSLEALDGLTIQEYYHKLVAGIGQDVSLKKASLDSGEVLVQELGKQQSELSGVDINSEAANMLVYQQMFQAMSKFIITIRDSIAALMEMV